MSTNLHFITWQLRLQINKFVNKAAESVNERERSEIIPTTLQMKLKPFLSKYVGWMFSLTLIHCCSGL